MKKIVLLVALIGLLCTPLTALASSSKSPNPKIVLVTKCSTSSSRPQPSFKGGSTFIKVRKGGCASVDKGATGIAYDDAVIAAHGDSVVIGYGHATLIIYNGDVTCAVHGANVSVIYAVKGGYLPPICRQFP